MARNFLKSSFFARGHFVQKYSNTYCSKPDDLLKKHSLWNKTDSICIQFFYVPRTIWYSIVSKQLRDKEINPPLTNHWGWLGMVNLTNIYTYQFINVTCPKPSNYILLPILSEEFMNEHVQLTNSRKVLFKWRFSIWFFILVYSLQKTFNKHVQINYCTDISKRHARVDAIIDYK